MKHTKFFAAFAVSLTLAFAGACSKKEEAPAGDKAATPATNEAPAGDKAAAKSPADEADEIYKTRCTACHGESGSGDGPAAANLDPKPANYTDAAFQDSVTDQQIEDAIVKGGEAVGKSNLMPPNPDLANKPEVVKALREKVRSFKK